MDLLFPQMHSWLDYSKHVSWTLTDMLSSLNQSPFLRGVTDTASFDRNLTAYVYDGYVNEKWVYFTDDTSSSNLMSYRYETLFGCSGINLDNSTMTSNLYARFTTTVICNGVVQNSISRCNLSASESHPVCADTCVSTFHDSHSRADAHNILGSVCT